MISAMYHAAILLGGIVLAAPAAAERLASPNSEHQMVQMIARSSARIARRYRRVQHLQEPLIKNCYNDKLLLIRGHLRLARQDLRRLAAARRAGRTDRAARVRLSRAFLQVTMAEGEAQQCRWLLGLSPGPRGRTVVKVQVHRSIPRADPTTR